MAAGKAYDCTNVTAAPRADQQPLVVLSIHCVALLLILAGTFSYGHLVRWEHHIRALIKWYLVAGSGYLLALYTLPRLPQCFLFQQILALAILLRLAVWPMQPADDINRYLWEGKIQHYGYNPYRYPPNQVQLQALRDHTWQRINHKDLTTIYPPLAQLVFYLAYALQPDLKIFKFIFALLDLACIGLLYTLLQNRQQPTNPRIRLLSVAIYAWNPLVILSFAGHGHLDVLQIFFTLLALIYYDKHHWGRMYLALSAAFLAKYWVLFLLPFFISRKNWTKFPIMLLTIILAYLYYWQPGLNCFATLLYFAQHFYHDGLWYSIATNFISPSNARYSGMILVLVVLFHAYRHDRDPLHNTLRIWGGLLLVAPTVHAWYLTSLVPFIAYQRNIAWLALSITMVFYYEVWIPWATIGRWEYAPLFFWATYLPFLILLPITQARDYVLTLQRQTFEES